MLVFLLKRLGVMMLTALCLTLIVFASSTSSRTSSSSPRSRPAAASPSSRSRSGSTRTATTGRWPVRYGEWLGGVVRGDLGHSTRFNAPVAEVLWPRLRADRRADVLGAGGDDPVGAAARGARRDARGLAQDRVLSTVAIATTSTPEYVSGVVLTVIFASQMSACNGFPARPPRPPTTARPSTTSPCRC